ncbi:MAG: EamA family transporter [Opitutaceae bacterium]|nr:EamA family transporter [Opitutaceae bacterium]
MFAAFLTTIFFSLSSIFANRSIRVVGATHANLGRLMVAAAVLGLYAHTLGHGLEGNATPWLLISGVIGMGLGDIAAFGAFPILGSRLTALVTQCLAAPIAAGVEYLWLGTTLTGIQVLWSTVILGGVGFALMPSRRNPPRVKVKPIGFLWGFFSAAGQGVGAVLSRKASEVANSSGQTLDGITGAYQRILGGLVIALLFFLIRAVIKRAFGGKSQEPALPRSVDRPWYAFLWIPANALSGAVIGVSCYQWALFTTSSGLVLPIVATTPLVIIPLSYWIERETPTLRSIIGAAIAVTGAVALTQV